MLEVKPVKTEALTANIKALILDIKLIKSRNSQSA